MAHSSARGQGIIPGPALATVTETALAVVSGFRGKLLPLQCFKAITRNLQLSRALVQIPGRERMAHSLLNGFSIE